MTDYLSRRQFLAAALAGNALAAFGQGRRPVGANKRPLAMQERQAAPMRVSTEPRLWLPRNAGEGADVRFANSPVWARNTPGWYIPSTVSAGCCMLDFPLISFMSSLIKNFRELPLLLDQARSLGTSTIYLIDWFEGKPGAPPFNYWMYKGDYVPRSDMGGEAALKEGLSAVHAQGGRVIVYVEGFIINKDSNVGQAHGAQWSIIGEKGPPEEPYPGTWKPCPGAEGWLAYVEGVARRIGGYGTDGIFFDSQGFQKDWKCFSKAHGHRPGDPEAFNDGCGNLLRRARAALHEGNPEAIIIIEGPTMKRLFEHIDGSMDWTIDNLVRDWLWDDQGKTDTITSSYSLDDWNQTLAIGAKLGFGAQFLRTPPGTSAEEFVGEFLKEDLPQRPQDLLHIAHHAFWGLHAWRNAGLILGLPMPGLDDISPRYLLEGEKRPNPFKHLYSSGEILRGVFEELRTRAAAIDNALAGKTAPSPAEYVKALNVGRAKLAPIIDHGSAVELVRTPFPRVVGWRFTSNKGMALTAVSVAEGPREISFPNTRGAWKDGFDGEVFTAQNNTLTLRVPPHRVRLLYAEE